MKKRFGLLTIVVLVLLVALVTMAPGPGPEPADCSPGFWKNHTELWSAYTEVDYNYYFTTPEKPDGFSLLDALQGGKDTRYTRHRVAEGLNFYFPDTICD